MEELIKNNEFPIIFIGAGISKRYLENYPGWLALLKDIWERIEDKNIYSELSIISEKIKTNNDKEKDFFTNVKMATLLENKIESKFNREELKIDGLTIEEKFFEKNKSL